MSNFHFRIEYADVLVITKNTNLMPQSLSKPILTCI